MAFVAPGIIRYSINGTIGGSKTWTNIWDVDVLADVEEDRGPIALRYAEVLMANYAQNLMLSMSTVIEMTSVGWVDLDSEDGSTGSITSSQDDPGPYFGQQSGEAISPQVTGLVTKQCISARGRRNGRMFLSGLREEDVDFDSLDSAYQGTLQTRLNSFLGAVFDPAEITVASCQPSVVHTRNTGTDANPVIEYVGKSNIQSLVLQGPTSTQRRRQRR